MDSSSNFSELQEQFNNYWEDRTIQKGLGHKQFARWMDEKEMRVYPSGQLPKASIAWDETVKFKENYPNLNLKSNSNWTQIMIQDTLSFTAFSGIPGHGRVTSVEVSPVDTNVIFIGTPSGGLWKTINGGNSWEPLTDDLPAIGVSDIAIDPTNPQVMYIATGDNNFINTYSIGVLKSLDGGDTWNTTGLSSFVSQTINIRRMLIHPTNPNTLWVATTTELLRTDDGGDNWYTVMNGAMRDVELDPNDPMIMYAATNGGFYKSIDGGQNFNPSGLLENSGIIRMELAISRTNPNRIYVIAADANTSGLYALYRSDDAGNSFVQTANTTNILGYFLSGGTGGQAWFDLDIAVDPNDQDIIYTAGIFIWKSTDAGDSFTPKTVWSNPTSNTYVHGDVHRLKFYGDKLITTCDGGIFTSHNFSHTWKNISGDLTISQIYDFSQSPFDENQMLAGMQDVGSSFYDGQKWTTVTWGDGFACFFDDQNPDKMYTSAHQAQLFRTHSGIDNFFGFNPPINESSAFRTVFEQAPSNSNTFFVGYQDVWRSTNTTSNWTRISNFGNSFPIRRIKVGKYNPDILYTTTNFYVYRSFNGGGTWTQVNQGLPTGVAALSSLEIHPTDSLQAWVGFSGYANGQKVYHTDDGGFTWTNISSNLPNLPINCILSEGGSMNGVYVGTDVGVYYKDDTMANWQQFMTGLPNVIVNDLLIVEASQKIRAATYGRGVWESNTFTDEILSQLELSSTNESHLRVYPNPVNDFVNVAFTPPDDFQLKEVQLIDVTGRIIQQFETANASPGLIQLDLSNIQNGSYQLIIQGKHEILTTKILKTK